jgi:hypothetical protein
VFGFIPESVFTFIPESRSESSRNGVHLDPGTAFAFARNPHYKQICFEALIRLRVLRVFSTNQAGTRQQAKSNSNADFIIWLTRLAPQSQVALTTRGI